MNNPQYQQDSITTPFIGQVIPDEPTGEMRVVRVIGDGSLLGGVNFNSDLPYSMGWNAAQLAGEADGFMMPPTNVFLPQGSQIEKFQVIEGDFKSIGLFNITENGQERAE